MTTPIRNEVKSLNTQIIAITNQNDHLREPGNWAGAGRKKSAADRRRPARQPDHQPGPSPAGQDALYPVRCDGPYPGGQAAAPRRGHPTPPGGR